MSRFTFEVSMDGRTSTREEIDADDLYDACDQIDARDPQPRWYDLARPVVKTAFRLSEIVRADVETGL